VATVPFLRTFPVGADAPPLAKLICFGTPSGYLVGPQGDASLGYEGWRPAGMTGREAALPARLPEMFRALEPYRDRLLFVEGLAGEAGPHKQSSNLLTGWREYEPAGAGEREFYSRDISIDQLFGRQTASRVLNLSFRIDGFAPGEGYWSSLGENRPVMPIQSPVDAFDRVFGASIDDPARREQRARRQSVLDTMAGDMRGLSARLPQRDRVRLEAHLESIRLLELELDAGAGSCTAGDAPGAYDYLSDARLPQVMRDHTDVLVQALACGFARAGTLQAGNFGGSHRPSWTEYGISTTYRDHAIAHKFGGGTGAGSDGLSREEAIRLGVRMQVAYNSMFAYLLERLSTTIDADGRPMIENTLVLHAKPMGMNHDKDWMLHVLAGGSGVGLRGGRYIIAGDAGVEPESGRADSDTPRVANRRYNDLLTGMCQSLGMPVTAFGNPASCQEPVALG
jgi:hypothetical protein